MNFCFIIKSIFFLYLYCFIINWFEKFYKIFKKKEKIFDKRLEFCNWFWGKKILNEVNLFSLYDLKLECGIYKKKNSIYEINKN